MRRLGVAVCVLLLCIDATRAHAAAGLCVHISDLCPHSGDTMSTLGTHVDFGLPRASLFLRWHRQYAPCNVYARLRPLSYCGYDSVFFVLDGADIGALAPV